MGRVIWSHSVIVAPDMGNAKQATKLARLLDLPIAAVSKQRIDDTTVEAESMIGLVKGRDAIIYDDEVATAGTVVETVRLLEQRGARSIRLMCAHGLFTGPAIERLKAMNLSEIITTNTVPIPPEKRLPNMTILSVGPVFAETIRPHSGRRIGPATLFVLALTGNAPGGVVGRHPGPGGHRMRRQIHALLVSGLLILVSLLAFPGLALAQAPELTTVDSQVTVLSDGQLDIKYSLTFLETTPRDRINTLGPLDAGHRLVDATITGPDGERTVNLESKGSNFYAVPFGFDTRAGESYTVMIHYHSGARPRHHDHRWHRLPRPFLGAGAMEPAHWRRDRALHHAHRTAGRHHAGGAGDRRDRQRDRAGD